MMNMALGIELKIVVPGSEFNRDDGVNASVYPYKLDVDSHYTMLITRRNAR